jgi:hypothetical protein
MDELLVEHFQPVPLLPLGPCNCCHWRPSEMRGKEGDGRPELAGVAAGLGNGGVRADRGLLASLICCVWPTARGRASSSSTPVGRPGARAPARAACGRKTTTRRRPWFGRLVCRSPFVGQRCGEGGLCRRRDRLEALGRGRGFGCAGAWDGDVMGARLGLGRLDFWVVGRFRSLGKSFF